MPAPRPPYLHRQVTRHGVVTWYVRQSHGKRFRLKAAYGTPQFWAEYKDALGGKTSTATAGKAKPHTLRWGVDQYRASSAWAQLASATRYQRENVFRRVLETAGSVMLSSITQETIRAGRERRAATPHAANDFLKTMRSFFTWALEAGLVESNPTTGVKILSGANDDVGFHTWTEEELGSLAGGQP